MCRFLIGGKISHQSAQSFQLNLNIQNLSNGSVCWENLHKKPAHFIGWSFGLTLIFTRLKINFIISKAGWRINYAVFRGFAFSHTQIFCKNLLHYTWRGWKSQYCIFCWVLSIPGGFNKANKTICCLKRKKKKMFFLNWIWLIKHEI